MILWKLCRILDNVSLTHLHCGPRTSTYLRQYSILIFLWIVSFITSLDLQVKITSSTCKISELNPYLISPNSKNWQKNLQIVSFKTPLDLQVKITSSTCKFLWSQNRILYQQLISAKHFQVKLNKKILQIVSFKTSLDLQVKITSSTCKISWVTK